MIMDCEKYTGPCVCGRVHTLETKKVVVDYNALANAAPSFTTPTSTL